MNSKETQRQKLDRVAKELGGMLRRQARRKWDSVRTAERNERGRHVWRFRSGVDGSERFLHVTHEALDQGESSSRLLFEQLKAGRWLDRLHEGPETALLLSREGSIEPWPQR
jgi:hypothetical protein